MKKPSPNPPETERIPSYADLRARPRKPSTMYTLNPELDAHSLLGDACESLASAHVMTLDLADRTEGPSRNFLLGIAQIIMLGELSVNCALDQLNPRE
ncbi:DUF6124 family protein [Pseudomonas baetica]|uniref:DUF6124 family protein n=1 Tax=Pseudomonas baetica TaxID=674054 RepID=UPI003EE9A7F1